MRIVIVTIGTRGDVQPYIALATGLQRAGHKLTICTHATFRPFVESHGVAFAPLAGDIRALLASDAGRRLVAQRNPWTAVRQLHTLAAPLLGHVMADILAATDGAELILGSTLGYLNAVTAAQVNDAPLVLAGLQPFTPTSAFPVPLLAPAQHRLPAEGGFNRLSFHIAYRLLQLASARLANRWRRELTGLRPLGYRDVFGPLIDARSPVLYGFSSHLLPRPGDYGAQTIVTGFWFLEQQPTWQPPEELAAFLAAGDPPVYIGFGSAPDRDPGQVGQSAIDALQQSGQRGILAAGWEGLATQRLPPTILQIDAAPHDWLFPRVSLVVHHGGIGTAAAALRAGVPQIVVPFSADQPFWAAQLYQRGVTPAPLPRRRLRGATLASAIRAALHDKTIQTNVRRLASALRQEDGVAAAVAAINRLRTP